MLDTSDIDFKQLHYRLIFPNSKSGRKCQHLPHILKFHRIFKIIRKLVYLCRLSTIRVIVPIVFPETILVHNISAHQESEQITVYILST